MSTITFPTFNRKPTSFEWQLHTKTGDTVSPFDLSSQQQEYVGARWGAVFEYLLIEAIDIQRMASFIARLRGRANRVAIYNIDRPRSQGSWSGTPLVFGAGHTGTSIPTYGWGAGSTVKRGDMVAIDGQLHMVTSDGAESGGAITLEVEPPRRAAPANNAPLTLTQATCLMHQTEDVARFIHLPSSAVVRPQRFTLQFIEVFA